MGLLGLSVDTESAERSAESALKSTGAQRSADSTVRIKQYSKKGGTMFGVFGQQSSSSNPAQVDNKTLSPSSSGICSPGSSQQSSPERVMRRSKSEPRRSRSDGGKEQSPGSDYGSLLSDTEGDSSLIKPRESPGEHHKLTRVDSLVLNKGESSGLKERESPSDDMSRQRRQRQRSASESISDKLSETQAQRDKDLEDLWPESNSLDRNASQYGNNAVAVRGAKLQQTDALQLGCQSKTAVETSGTKSNNSNNEFRFEDKNAAAITGAKSPITKDYTSQDRKVVATTGAKSLTSDSYRSCCQNCRKEQQLTPSQPLELHTLHSCNTLTKPKHPSLLPKSRSFVLPMRPSLTELRPQHRESCNIDKVQGAGKQPETYLQHLTNQPNADIEDNSIVNSIQDTYLGGLTNNKCNNSSNTDLYSSSKSCHGDQVESAGIWASGSVGCHGSSLLFERCSGCTQ